jgi:RNA polymerase sigma-70 factor (ECF subfamily)
MHEAFARVRHFSKQTSLDAEEAPAMVNPENSPERNVANMELHNALESAISSLPQKYRCVMIMRDVEEMNTTETAAALDLTEENVKVRLHRGRLMVRNWLMERVGTSSKNAFPFMGERCDRVVAMVFTRISPQESFGS